jgi:D-alanyl-D-alanine carboxypeptidase
MLAPRAARAWARMVAAARQDGVQLLVVSAFRSTEYQLGILRRKLERGLTIEEILRVSAAPGYSEHHSGRALDITTPGFAALEEEFEQSPAFAWLDKNALPFGFHLSYPRANRHAIAFEPWHWCWHEKRGR